MQKKWYLENCKQDALQYKTRTEWARNSSGAYDVAAKNLWLDECCLHMPKIKSWTLETCKEDAQKYLSKSQWEQESATAYNKARRKGWLKECCPHMISKQKPSGYWNFEKCIEEARKYTTIADWQEKSASSYGAASNKGWLEKCNSHMVRDCKPAGYWTFERCKEEALKYKSKAEWQTMSSSSYQAATRKKWANKFNSHFSRPPNHNLKWTKELCIEDALKYKSKQEWRNAKQSGYSVASKRRWLTECCSHMKSFGGSSLMEKELHNFIATKVSTVNNKRFTNRNPKFFAKSFELDIYIPELNKAVEFDGRYWHSLKGLKRSNPTWPMGKLEQYHELKDSFFKSKGINVLHIKESDWRKNKHKEIIKVYKFINGGL